MYFGAGSGRGGSFDVDGRGEDETVNMLERAQERRRKREVEKYFEGENFMLVTKLTGFC